MKPTDVWSAHGEWTQSLLDFLGCPLRLVEGSETVDIAAASGTLRGVLVPPHPGVMMELLVKLLMTRQDDGEVAIWALVFFFVDKQSVAPQGKFVLALEWSEGQWHHRHWEPDEYDEWTELETLD
jgi:hypothetical protein